MTGSSPLDDGGSRVLRRIRRLRDGHPGPGPRRFLVEGVRLVDELLAAGLVPEVAVYAPRLLERPGGVQLLRRLEQAGVRVLHVTDRLFSELSDTQTPQGILATVRAPEHSLPEVLSSPCPWLVVADRVQDPGNLGTLVRTVDAVGATGVLAAAGTVDFASPKVVRASMGSVFRVPVVPVGNVDWRRALRERGVRLVALDPEGGTEMYAADLTGPLALWVGNEGWGLPPAELATADAVVRIPMPGRATSLNAAVAGAVVLYESLRQRRRP